MDTLSKLLFNLETIANIPKGKRISTAKEFITIDEDSVIQGYWRWKVGDSRDKAIHSICREVRTTITIVNFIMESQYICMRDKSDELSIFVKNMYSDRVLTLKKIRSGLLSASIGINNICITYDCDSNVLANLQPILNEINSCICQITQLLISISEN